MLPILHLNGYKISGPTVLGRDSDDDIRALLQGNGYEAFFVEGDDPPRVHQAFAATLDRCYDRIRAIQQEARQHGVRAAALAGHRPAHAEGLDRPKEVDGLPSRAPSVPTRCRWRIRTTTARRRQLEAWMRTYQPESLFDAASSSPSGRPRAER